MAQEQAKRPQRSDAVRNRAALVATAAEAFRDDGLGVSVNEIARRANVNVATLYRHFPTKDALVDAVLGVILDPLRAASAQALQAAPGEVLATFVRDGARLQAEHRGLVEALATRHAGTDVLDRLRGPAYEMVAPIVEAAHAGGELRADFDATDVLIVMRMISVITGSAQRASKDLERYVDFALRGLL